MVRLSDFDFLKYVNVHIFLISLAIGIFLVYITAPPLKVIMFILHLITLIRFNTRIIQTVVSHFNLIL